MIGILAIFLACTLWAVDTLIRYPLLGAGVSAESIVFSEHLILVLLFLPLLWQRRSKWGGLQLRQMGYFAVVGGLGSGIATLAFTAAFMRINPSLVILLQKLQPLVAITLARVVLREPLHPRFLAWACVCLLGGVMVSWHDLAPVWSALGQSDLTQNSVLIGHGLALLAVVSWGSATVYGKRLALERYDELDIMAGRFVAGLVGLLVLGLIMRFVFAWAGTPLSLLAMEGAVWGKIALMVGLSGLLGMFVYYKGLNRLPARVCTLAEMFFPFCAVAVNWIFLDATLRPLQILGGGLLLWGATVIQLKHY